MGDRRKLDEFLLQREVFTIGDLDTFLSEYGSGNLNTRKALLTYYKNQGRVIPVRRGLYAVVPPGSLPESTSVDPFLLASKITHDAVLSYHTALEFHGKAYSVYTRVNFLTSRKTTPLHFRGYEYISVPVPKPLREKKNEMYGVVFRRRNRDELRVTNYERTMVDVLDRPELTGSWEEIFRSLQSIEFFDLDQVVEYVYLLRNSTTAAKVGYFLEKHKEVLMVEETHLDHLRKLRPRQPHYLIRGKRRGCNWIKNWNLMIPPELLNESWGGII